VIATGADKAREEAKSQSALPAVKALKITGQSGIGPPC
jgi:hypothetical protein